MNPLLPTLAVLAASSAWQAPDLDLLRQPMMSAYRQGTNAFRRVLQRAGYTEPASSLVEVVEDPDNSLLVVLGDATFLNRNHEAFSQFIQKGGSVLIATDRPGPEKWQDLLGVRVGESRSSSNSFVYCNREGDWVYQGNVNCPFARPLGALGEVLLGNAPRVATNRPGYLSCDQQAMLQPFAGFPLDGECVTENGTPLQVGGENPKHVLAAGGQREGDGRVLVIADHSIFINDMMLRDDLDNIQFAANCLAWLNGGTLRSRVLLVEEGAIQTNLQEEFLPPLPPPEALIPLLNEGLHGLQRENLFNRILDPFWERILLGVAALLTFFLVAYGWSRLGRSRYREASGSPPLEKLLTRQATSAAVVELRHQAMLKEGNLWEAARALARQCFDGAFRDTAAVELSQLAAEWGEPPRVLVSGGWWRRWRLGKQARRLWQLAYDPLPVAVSAREFTQLVHEARAVRTALADGTVRIEPP